MNVPDRPNSRVFPGGPNPRSTCRAGPGAYDHRLHRTPADRGAPFKNDVKPRASIGNSSDDRRELSTGVTVITWALSSTTRARQG
jgi:hypothetical protein